MRLCTAACFYSLRLFTRLGLFNRNHDNSIANRDMFIIVFGIKRPTLTIATLSKTLDND